MFDDQQHWDAHLPEVKRHLNSAVNKASDNTPFEAVHGYCPRFHGGGLLNHSRTRDDWTDPSIVQDQARQRIEENQLRTKGLYDRRHHSGVMYDVGEVVVMLRQSWPDQNS